jgi:hypothetical protein
MSYYILPKNYNLINLNPFILSNNIDNNYIYYSFLNYYINLKNTLYDILENNDNSNLDNELVENCVKIISPYEYVFSNIPGKDISVSNLLVKTPVFYDYLEIINTLNLLENFTNNNIKSLHISKTLDTVKCLKMLRNKKFNDLYSNFNSFDIFEKNIFYSNNNNNKFFNNNKYDIIYYETDLNNYILSITNLLLIILKNQNYFGNAIIKISYLNKPIIDIIYFLSSLYESIYIGKPYTSNIISFDRYIICKNFLLSEKNIKYIKLNYYKVLVFIKKLNNEKIGGLLNFEIPYYFKNKLDDLIILLGQKQIEAMDNIISILKNKNNNRIEILKKNNIQKCINWCEKNNIPYNKIDL